MPGSAAELAELLELERLDLDLFRGRQADTERQRVFGGQVAAQAMVAATSTVGPKYHLHSLHSTFLRPGDAHVPIIYDVERLRDGRSFATRHVTARQHGKQIFTMLTSHQVLEESTLFHADRMPEVCPPEQAPSLSELIADRLHEPDGDWDREWAALAVRHVGSTAAGLPEDSMHPAQARIWIRVDGRLSDDPMVQQAAFTYASDLTLLGSAMAPHGLSTSSPGVQAASLDHTIWFHRPFRADEWWLYDQVSPAATQGRALVTANVFSQQGELLATVAQQGLMRYHPSS